MADTSTTSADLQSRYCVPTTLGNALFAAAAAGEGEIEFTACLFGDGTPDDDVNPQNLTTLVSYVNKGTLSQPIRDDTKVNIKAEYQNSLNPEQEMFWLREFGIWAKLKDSEDAAVMCYYGNMGDYAEAVEAYDGTHVTVKTYPLTITVGATGTVTVSFSTDAFVTSQDMADYVADKTGTLPDGASTIAEAFEQQETALKEYADTAVDLTQATEATELSDTDLIGVQAADDTAPNKMTLENFASEIQRLNFAGTSPNLIALHNSIRRGKVLTDSYTLDEILTMVAAQNYEDIWVGDIINVTVPAISATGWSEGAASFYVAEIESHSKYGDTKITKGHLCLIPVTQLGAAYMNSSNITTGAYTSSYMNATVMPAVATALKSAFGSSHIIASRELLTSAVNTSANSKGVPTATGATYWNSGSWSSCDCRLMNENEVYGNSPFSSSGEDDRSGLPAQLALFKADARTIVTEGWYWLSSVAHASSFCRVTGTGNPDHNGASLVFGVRPRFLIG